MSEQRGCLVRFCELVGAAIVVTVLVLLVVCSRG